MPAGAVFQIVEQNPTRTVELKIFDDYGGIAPTDDANTPADETDRVIAVVNSGVGKENIFRYEWDVANDEVGTAADPQVFKFDLVAQRDFSTRTVAEDDEANGASGNAEFTISARTEPLDYWVGRTITIGTRNEEGVLEDSETRLITAYDGAGAFTVSHAFTSSVGDDYVINIYDVPAYEDQTASFQYGIFRRNVTTDKIGPIISNVTPAKGAVVQDGEIVFQADVIDVSSGYSSDEDKLEDVRTVANGRIALEVLGEHHPRQRPRCDVDQDQRRLAPDLQEQLRHTGADRRPPLAHYRPGTGLARRPSRTIPPAPIG